MSLRTLKWQNTKVVSRRGKNPSLCFSREASTNSDSESSPVLSHLKEHVNPRKQGLPCGLKNLINSCYLNCTLQVLLYTPFLASFCLANGHSSSCEYSKYVRMVINVLDFLVSCSLQANLRQGRSHALPAFLKTLLNPFLQQALLLPHQKISTVF